MHRQPLEKAETMPEAGDETREAKSAQVTEPNMLRGMNRSVPAEAIEGVVKRIDLARPEIFWPTRKRSQMSFEGTDETPSTGAVDQVVGGIRRQHVSRSSSRSRERKEDGLSRGEARRNALARSSRWAEAKRYAKRFHTSSEG